MKRHTILKKSDKISKQTVSVTQMVGIYLLYWPLVFHSKFVFLYTNSYILIVGIYRKIWHFILRYILSFSNEFVSSVFNQLVCDIIIYIHNYNYKDISNKIY